MYKDLSLLLSLQSWTETPLLYWISIFASKYLILFFAVIIAFLGFGKHRKKNRVYAYTAAWAALLALGSSLVIGFLMRRPRPFTLPSVITRIEPPLTQYSLPSSHSAIAFAIASSLALANPWLGAIGFLLAILIAFARVAVGVHFPTDVLAGAALGIASSLFVHWYRLYFLPKSMRKKK